MRKFNITVNGRKYEVEVEEVGGVAAGVPVVQAPAPAPAPVPQAGAPAPKVEEMATKEEAPVQKKAAAAAPVDGKETISAPMPGTILSINVKEGDMVKRGDVLFILEAMKMENEVMAGVDGKVASIGVTKGASVNTGDMLAVIA